MSSNHHSKRSSKNKNKSKNKNMNNKNKSNGSSMESEPHSYNIQAKLQNGILSIFVHDTMTNLKWRQEFTQISFPGHKLYNVAKSLIMAIQEMIDNTNYSTSGKSTNDNDTEKKPIAILVYNQWCYLTIHGSNLPSFALRPINKEQNQTIIHSQNHKNKNKNKNQQQNNIQLKTIKPSIAPYGFTTNSQNKNIKFGDQNRDKRINKNITFKKGISNDDNSNYRNRANSSPSSSSTNTRRPKSKSTPIIVVNKGVVARNIARFSNNKKQNETVSNTNDNKTPYSRKSNTNKRRKSKKSNKHNGNNTNNNNSSSKSRKKLPSNPPPTLNNPSASSYQHQQYQSLPNTLTTNLSPMQPMRPPTPSRNRKYFPGRPLPTLPIGCSSLSYHGHNSYQQPTIHRHQSYPAQHHYYTNTQTMSNQQDHNYSNSMKFVPSNTLSQPVQPRYSASATNNIRFQQMLMGRNHGSVSHIPSNQTVQPYIPAPPIPKKQIMAKKSQVTVTVIGHNYNQNQQQRQREQFEPGQVSQSQSQEPGQQQSRRQDKDGRHSPRGEYKQEQQVSTPKYKKHDSIPVPQASLMGNRSNSSSGASSGGSSALSGVTNLSGVSHLDVLGCSSSEYEDEDDGIMANTDDEDSSSFKNIGHRSDDSNQGSMESNTGSLDSLFTNDGGDGIITGFMTEQQYNQRTNHSNRSNNNRSHSPRHQQVDSAKLNLPANKMKLYDSITTIDMNEQHESSGDDNYHNDDVLECEFSGNEEEYEIDQDFVDYEPRQSGPCGFLFNASSNRTNQTNASLITHLTGRPTKRGHNEWNDHYDNDNDHDQLDIDDQTEGHTVNSSLYYHNTMSDDEEDNHCYNHRSSKKKKKKGKKSKKMKKKRNSIKLTICLNGAIIDDMVEHVIDQQIAEEEYYEEEDAMSEPYYDPNYLGVSPYYSD